MSDQKSGTGVGLQTVRLFPLPNVVLFPKAVLPLHIFEERYKEMTADALASDRLVAMALLKPGWEKSYYGRPAIEPVVCVGRILTYERLADGKYNFLLEGVQRATIVREVGEASYRMAEVRAVSESALQELDLSCERWRLTEMFLQEDLGRMGQQFQELLNSSLKTAEVADLIAFNLFDDTGLKLSLLADGDVERRVKRVVDALEDLLPTLRRAVGGRVDPGMN